jgi:hypothetical protein
MRGERLAMRGKAVQAGKVEPNIRPWQNQNEVKGYGQVTNDVSRRGIVACQDELIRWRRMAIT